MSLFLKQQFESAYKKMVPFDQFLGMNLTVISPGKVSYELVIKPHHLTAPESAHGGVTAAMMDATLGVAALSYAVSRGNLCATVEFKLNYLEQVRPEYTLVSSGNVNHTGTRLIVSEGKIKEKTSGKLIAVGLGTFSQYPIEKRSDVNGYDKLLGQSADKFW